MDLLSVCWELQLNDFGDKFCRADRSKIAVIRKRRLALAAPQAILDSQSFERMRADSSNIIVHMMTGSDTAHDTVQS